MNELLESKTNQLTRKIVNHEIKMKTMAEKIESLQSKNLLSEKDLIRLSDDIGLYIS